MKTDWDVIVVGGGLSGLAAGATAAARGASTVVLEGHQAGGRARTTQKDGFVFNMGGHALYLGGPGTKVLRALGVEPDGLAPPLDRYQVLQGGRLHLLPHNPGSLLRTTALSRRGKTQFAKLLGLLPLMTPDRLAGTSVQQWLDDRGLHTDVAGLVRAIIRISTYTADVDEFSAGHCATADRRPSRCGLPARRLGPTGARAEPAGGSASRLQSDRCRARRWSGGSRNGRRRTRRSPGRARPGHARCDPGPPSR